ncbi:hypothetical protein ABZP36_011138 [Zizania latifolia]
MDPLFPKLALPKISGSRLLKDFLFVATTGDIDAKVVHLANHCLVAWASDIPVGWDRADSNHFAEDFKRPWDIKLHANPASLPYNARICIEGLPMHAWNDQTVAQVVGHSCYVHFPEEYSRRTNYTHTFDLWVWCQHLDAIPKIVWLTIANPDPVQAPIDIPLANADPYDDSVSGLKLGHSYKVLLYVDKIEDLSYGAQVGHPCAQSFDWQFGVSDGEDSWHLPKYHRVAPTRLFSTVATTKMMRMVTKTPRHLCGKSIWSHIG